jgi:crossover junction endodeoxyribonuclease RuvC
VRVLGVDPGLTRCGLGVVDGGPGRTVRCVDVGVARTPADDDLARRLLQLAEVVEDWLDRHRPEVVAIERVFAQHNVRTAMGPRRRTATTTQGPAGRGRGIEARPRKRVFD